VDEAVSVTLRRIVRLKRADAREACRRERQTDSRMHGMHGADNNAVLQAREIDAGRLLVHGGEDVGRWFQVTR